MSTSSSTGSISSLPGGGPSVGVARFPTTTGSTTGGMRRDISGSSLASTGSAFGGEGGFRANLRSAAKPPDFHTTDTPPADDGDEPDRTSSTSDTIAQAKKKLNAHATRMAIMDKSNAMVKAGRESMCARKPSQSEDGNGNMNAADAPTPPWANRKLSSSDNGQYPRPMPRSASGSSIVSNHSGTVAELRGRFGTMAVGDEQQQQPNPPTPGGNPLIANRPAILQSNQSYTPPRLPSRGTASGTSTPPIASRDITPSAAPPPPPARPEASVNRSSTSSADEPPVRLVKPSDLKSNPNASPFENTLKAQTNQQQSKSAPSLPSRKPPVPASNPLPQPARQGAGIALGLPTAVQVNTNPINMAAPPPIPSRSSATTTISSSSSSSSSNPNLPTRPPPPPARRPAPPRPHHHHQQQPISPDAVARYTELFIQTDTDRDAYVTGEEARSLWLKSGLDNRTLGVIWYLADRDEDGMLDKNEFCIGE
ncbi:hypothetical protein DFJ77DRAFT_254705 [Powellomyces hirtus]|nr:hypothetical protein DFJ77DRAFT_254705 [Powellomyces hirtus]